MRDSPCSLASSGLPVEAIEALRAALQYGYDDFEYMDRVVDPGYVASAAMIDLWTRVTMRLAEAELVPLHYSATGTFALDELQGIEERADMADLDFVAMQLGCFAIDALGE